MKITYDRKTRFWWAFSSWDYKDDLKASGWKWMPARKVWVTGDLAKVSPYLEHVPPDDEAVYHKLATLRDSRYDASYATKPLFDNGMGGKLYDYQVAGVQAITNYFDNCLLADEMGLGKTIQAIVAAGLLEVQRVLVICPPSLLINWEREWQTWASLSMQVTFQSWAMLAKSAAHEFVWDLVIVDEAHYAKSYKSARTKALLKIKSRYKLALTGTPILNKPVELWPILNWLDPVAWSDFWPFVNRYCDPQETRYGVTCNGFANISELNLRLRQTVMIRRMKSEVLPQLPAKRRQPIFLAASKAVQTLIAEEFKAYDAYKAMTGSTKLDAGNQLATLRRELGESKVKAAVEHISELAEQGQVVVFAHHRAVIDQLSAALKDWRLGVITGSTSKDQRQRIVDDFQAGHLDILIGNIQAAGVGITLTAASVCVFVEMDWVPANMVQAEDRLHRIGQKDSVLVQYLVYPESLDGRMASVLAYKQGNLDKLDEREGVL